MSKPIKILWISSNVPVQSAASAGGNTFSYYFSKFYNDDRFDVKIIAQSNVKMSGLRPLLEVKEEDCFYLFRYSSLKDKLKRLSCIESKYNPWNRNANLISNQFESFVKKTIRILKCNEYEPDVIILEWTQCVVMARLVKKYYPKAKLVASEHDVVFIGFERKAEYYSGLKGLFWKHKAKWEKNIEVERLKMCDLVLPHNADNSASLKAEGVSSEKIQGLTPYFNNMSNIQRKPNGRDILFFGAMSRDENSMSAMWFIKNVMSKLDDLDVRFVILGGGPPKELKDCESERIHVTGFVEDVVPYFEDAVCFVAPLLLGAGIKVKILEGLSSGVPVLTNEIGIEGIPAENGKDYIYCETAEEYEQAVREVFSDENRAEQICRNSRIFIQQNFDLEGSVKKYGESIVKLAD